MFTRESTRCVRVGDLMIGGGNKVLVQSMTKTDTRDIESTVSQIKRLEDAGCDLVRLAIVDLEAAEALKQIKERVKIPLVADIHFDYRLAIASMEAGVDKLRINPGNIGDSERVKAIVTMAKIRGTPIRIGVNGGSLKSDESSQEKSLSSRMVQSLKEHIMILEDLSFYDIVISLKASDVRTTVEAYKMCAEEFSYPLHIGLTESGPIPSGLVKSSIGVGILLYEGLGDTIRVSLTERPEAEVYAGFDMLRALNLRMRGLDIVSCPTCGRCRVNLKNLVDEVIEKTSDITEYLKVAIMGCEVNGPNEAKEADVGLACGKGCGALFTSGEIFEKVSEEEMVDTLVFEIRKKIE